MITYAEQQRRESAKNAVAEAIKTGDLELKAKADAEAPAARPWGGLYKRRGL